MGKSQKPLRILVHPDLLNWDELQELAAKGHEIKVMEPGEFNPDLILGPTCWRMEHSTRKYVKLAVEEARKVRYAK